MTRSKCEERVQDPTSIQSKPSEKKAMNPQDPLSTILSDIRAVADGCKHFYEEHKEGLEAIAWFGKEYESELKRSNNTQHKAINILKEHGWFLTPSGLPNLLIYPVVAAEKKPGDQSKAIDDIFVRHFTDGDYVNLEQMVTKWGTNPFFKGRMQILRDCVSALRVKGVGYNPSNVVIPTLVSQIDGVQTEYLVHWEHTFDINKKKWIDKTGKPLYKKDKKTTFEKNARGKGMFLSNDMVSQANNSLFDDLWRGAWTTHPVANSFNRNKIMHGEELQYGSLPNSIRAFLYLDFLAHLKRKDA